MSDNNDAAPPVKGPAEGWGQPQAYDYEQSNADWDGNRAVYAFDTDEYGDVGPAHEELEREIFGDTTNATLTGIAFETIDTIKVEQRGDEPIVPIKTFDDAGFHPVMLENIHKAGYRAPTPIQRYTFPAVKEGFDIVAVAQTGSGKTAAFLAPILNALMGKAKKLAAPRPNPATFMPGVTPPVRAEPLVLIVAPSRELAVQIFNEARKFCYRTMLRPCVVYGGGFSGDQRAQLARGCDVLIGTPGRLCDFIGQTSVLSLRRLRYLVLDEADEMLHDDWNDELGRIMSGGDQEEGNIKYMLFSATFPKALRDLARTHLATDHKQISVGRIGSTHGNILQRVIEVTPETKRDELTRLLQSIPPCRTIVFVNSKRTADDIDDFLFNTGFPSVSMHGDRTQREREAAMRAFRKGTSSILVATGVTARGIDVRFVNHVINYDLPSVDYGGIEEYTHRIGRTGRIGHKGLASSLYNPDRDEAIADVLVRTLLETQQEIPEFLQRYVPEDKQNLKWETSSNPEDRPDTAAGDFGASASSDDAWGNGDHTNGSANGDAWGAGNDAWGNGNNVNGEDDDAVSHDGKASASQGGDNWGGW